MSTLCPVSKFAINAGMTPPIVRTFSPVTLIGGGWLGAGDLDTALARAPVLVAADGGAVAALAAGHVPHAVIGDFDSLTRAARDRIPQDRLFEIGEQDSTDFAKALRSIDAPLVIGVGFLGGRLDHQLAVLGTLLRHRDRPCILLGAQELVFHLPPVLDLDLAPGAVVSLFPLQPVTGRSQGLEWPIDGLDLDPGGRVGTSNRARGKLRLEIDGPGLLAMVPRAALDALMQAIAPSRPGR